MGVPVTLPFNLTNGTTADATQVMADLNAIVTALAASAAASGVNSDITALTALTTPLSPAQGGTTAFFGGTSTGSASAQVVNPTTPNTFALVRGYTVVFIAGFSVTGATTLAANGTAATNILKQTTSGLQPLNNGDFLAGQVVFATYDGTQYQLLKTSDVTALMAASTLAGNPTGAAAPGTAITIGGGLSFSGTTLSSSAFVPNVQVLLSGTAATYTTPTNGGVLPLYLRIRMVGGGGAAGGGGNGTNSSFGGWTAVAGAQGGSGAGSSGGAGGSGGTNGTGTLIARIAGGAGQGGSGTANNNNAGGMGGATPFGGAGGGGNSASLAAAANSGSGGGGTNAGSSSNAGGGASEYVEFIVPSPVASYIYTVGPGGGNGAAGRIEVIGYWQ